MKNILYIGPYQEQTGIGKSSKRYVEYLANRSDINLAIRPVFFYKPYQKIIYDNKNVIEFEQNTFKNYDIVIQHGYPTMFEYNKNFGKNIGIVEIETQNLRHSGWIDNINLMDEIIVGSIYSANSLIDSGVDKPIKIFPEPYNLISYTTKYSNFFEYSTADKPYIFYTIGNYTEKHNIKNIILAFLLEFDNDENVKLFIKTSSTRYDDHNLKELIEFDINQIKLVARKNKIPNIDLLCGYLNDLDIIRLHQSGDTYINAVRGDGFGCNAIEAMLSDSLVINTANIGSNTYINNINGFIIDSHETKVISEPVFDTNVLTHHESWFEPNIDSLRQHMRTAYMNGPTNTQEKKQYFEKEIFDQNTMDIIL